MKLLQRILTFIICFSSFVLNGFSTTTPFTSSSDAYVSKDAPTYNFGTEETIGIGYGDLIGYIKFNLSSLQNVSVQSAKLKLYCPSTSFSTGTIVITTAGSSWTESGLTYNNRPSPIDPFKIFTTPGTAGWWTIDVTTIVEEWVEKGEANNGLRLDKGESGLIMVSSKESSGFAPKLEITYSVNQFSASGKVLGSQNEGVQQVELSFSRLSGTGSIPGPVMTNAFGDWFQSGFDVGTTYKVSPRHTVFNYVFTPEYKNFVGTTGVVTTGLDFTTTTIFSITFTSVPDGATVYRNFPTPDNTDFKTTPCTFSNITVNQLFTIIKPGYYNQEYISTLSDAGKTINVVLAEIKPIAEIIDFVVPTGLKARETNHTVQVTIKNNGNVARSFWVGISFANQFALGESWPVNWYDIFPKETEIISPGNTDVVTFEIRIPRNWIAGQYYATTAIWNDFDEVNFIMVGLPSQETSQYDIPFDRLTWHPEFTDKPDVGKESIFLSTFDSPITLESIFGQLVTEFSNGALDELYHLHGLKPLFFVSAKAQYNFLVNGFPINISAGGALFVDLADFCEYTPEGKEGWTTIWIASKIGAISFDLTKSIDDIKPGLTCPVDAGVVLKQFDYNKRGIADLRLDRLEYGKFSVRGLSITAFSYEWGGNLKFLNIKTGGSFQKGIKFAAADATNYVYQFEINTSYLKYALRLADLSLSFQNSSDYVDKFLRIIEESQDTPSTFKKFTYDDGYWEIQNGIPERNLSMDLTNSWWTNSKHCFKIKIPENTSKLTISTREGIGQPPDGYGDLRIYWRRDHPVFETGIEFDGWSSYIEGSVNEDCIINNPPAGEYFIALPVLAPTNRYENVTLIANYETINSVITVTSPNGGENWQVGSSQNITWNSSGTNGNVRIEYSTNNGSSWATIIASTSDDGSYTWTVPNSTSTSCLVRVSDIYGSPTDQSNSVFTITSINNQPNKPTLLTPLNGSVIENHLHFHGNVLIRT